MGEKTPPPQHPPVPTTPLRNLPLEKAQSTPGSRGSASDENYASENHQSEYFPYLKEDLATQETVTFERFLELILPSNDSTASHNSIVNVSTSPKFRQLFADYQQAFADETSLYHPFVELVNYCVDQFPTSGEGTVLCRNDPAIVRGSHGRRKPDAVTVSPATLNIGDRGNTPENLKNGGPTRESGMTPFHWIELLGFWEFKVDDPDVQTPLSAIPKQEKKSKKTRATRPAASTDRETRSKHSIPSDYSLEKRSHDISPPPERAPKRSKTIPPEIQCASYAVELLSHGDLRTHVIGALVTPDSIQMLYYDHSIVVKSDPISLREDPIRFITLLSRIASLTRAQWGYATALTEAPTPSVGLSDGISDRTFVGKTLQLTNGWMLEFGATVFEAHGLIGRGTCVVHATVIASTDRQNIGKLVIVKWSWSPRTRTQEASIIKAATTRANETGDTWVLDHLPIVLHSQEVDDADSPKLRLFQAFEKKYELRDLRITVQEELTPIEHLTTAPELTLAIRGIFNCYRWLFEKARVMHRDVSLGNLMYRIKDGKIFGVLNDFDLSLLMDATDLSTSKQRTGTKPFMAIDLLVPQPPTHLYRHDLESLFYVILWIITSYHDGKRVDEPPLRQWKHLGMERLQKEKSFFFLLTEPPQPTENFTVVAKTWIRPMFAIFIQGLAARRSHDPDADRHFDNATLGDHVSFATFAEIVDRELK
ncbi:hypothetical protein B0H16DRAFT_1437217 [Mycena metata]|uniref:Protein kinase domain-containing protein n=1 Tax=Mycena metata TaxID=1033252 RepID=A0AAD7H5R3_9AGAR|nr:hypothetical protein B0H16DRAFT_1437217 [Mycena metata]